MWTVITVVGLMLIFGGLGMLIYTGFLDWDDKDYDFKHNFYFIGGMIICSIGGFISAHGAMNI